MEPKIGFATSFADPKDVEDFKEAYEKFKEQGLTKEEAENKAYSFGDNGEGCWGDNTKEGSGPSCAIIPEDMEDKWGLLDGKTLTRQLRNARFKKVLVEIVDSDKQVTCLVKDRMPHRKNVKNNAVIDLNPDAVRALGFEPPFKKKVKWSWV